MMNEFNPLDNEEQELMESIQNAEWRSVDNIDDVDSKIILTKTS